MERNVTNWNSAPGFNDPPRFPGGTPSRAGFASYSRSTANSNLPGPVRRRPAKASRPCLRHERHAATNIPICKFCLVLAFLNLGLCPKIQNHCNVFCRHFCMKYKFIRALKRRSPFSQSCRGICKPATEVAGYLQISLGDMRITTDLSKSLPTVMGPRNDEGTL